MADERAGSAGTAPERLAPERQAAERSAPDRPAPERQVPERRVSVRPAPDRLFGLSWLENLGRQSLDPGYGEAAGRRGRPHARPARQSVTIAWLALAMVVAGVTLGVAVRSRQINAPSAAKAKQGVLSDVSRAQQRERALEASASALGQEIRSRQQALGAGRLEALRRLEANGGLTPVGGPGLRIVIDSGRPNAGGSTVILDRDIQLLVNGLWAAGAEAVAVGGNRMRATSAIRQAGGAILVDNKPTFWPITIDAVGNPEAMQVGFAGTTGYGRFTSFAANYGIRFDVSSEQRLQLPGSPAPDLRYAVPYSAAGTAASRPGAGATGTVTGTTR
jgi:uncharacterized protein YlxW (UPF0749 family)